MDALKKWHRILSKKIYLRAKRVNEEQQKNKSPVVISLE